MNNNDILSGCVINIGKVKIDDSKIDKSCDYFELLEQIEAYGEKHGYCYSKEFVDSIKGFYVEVDEFPETGEKVIIVRGNRNAKKEDMLKFGNDIAKKIIIE